MANPQAELFTKIDNQILWAMLSLDLTANEYAVLLALVRLIWGFKKGSREDRMVFIALSVLTRVTGLSRSQCSRALSGLVAKNIVLREVRGTRLFLGIQKDYDQWLDRRTTEKIEDVLAGSRLQTVADGCKGLPTTVADGCNEPLQTGATDIKKGKERDDGDARACEGPGLIGEHTDPPACSQEDGATTTPSTAHERATAILAAFAEIPEDVRHAYENIHPTVSWNGEIPLRLRELCRRYGPHLVRDAIFVAESSREPLSFPMMFITRHLERANDASSAQRPPSSVAERWFQQQGIYRALRASGRNIDDRRITIATALHALQLDMYVDPALDDRQIVLLLCRATNTPIPDFAEILNATPHDSAA